MKYLSLFTGIGGFELGIQRAYENHGYQRQVQTEPANVGHQPSNRGDDVQVPSCVGYSEIDKYAVQIYQSHFPDHRNHGDITRIDERTLPDFDLIVGGFPCQSFSIAGKRGGFSDTRGTLFFDIARILQAKQPRLLLLENVKGLLSHDDGRTFKTIIATLDELGYDLQWQVLNSKNHGVPQNRERVFIVGHLRGTRRPQVFPLGEDASPLATKGGKQPSDAVVSRTLTAPDAKMHLDGNYVQPKRYLIEASARHEDRVYTEVAPTVQSSYGTGGGHVPLVVKDPETKIRRLTPTECERLQGFPDGWTEGVSDTQRYKTLGNAVTVNVIEAIVSRMI